MPIIAPYCSTAELLLEQTIRKIPSAMNLADYTAAADREINAKLGLRYRIPLTVNGSFLDQYGNPLSDFPQHEKDLIRDIAVKLSSGRVLVQVAADSDDNLSKYGWELIKEAQYFLSEIAAGEIRLSGLATVGAESDDWANMPGIANRDHASMVEGFEERFHAAMASCASSDSARDLSWA